MAISQTLKSYIGKSTKPRVIDIEKNQIRRFAAAIGEDSAIHYDETIAKKAGYSSIVGPLTFPAALHEVAPLFEELGLNESATMHQEEEYEYFRPICAGDELTITHKVIDLFEKQTPNGVLLFVVIETRGNDKKNKPVFKGRRVVVELKRA